MLTDPPPLPHPLGVSPCSTFPVPRCPPALPGSPLSPTSSPSPSPSPCPPPPPPHTARCRPRSQARARPCRAHLSPLFPSPPPRSARPVALLLLSGSGSARPRSARRSAAPPGESPPEVLDSSTPQSRPLGQRATGTGSQRPLLAGGRLGGLRTAPPPASPQRTPSRPSAGTPKPHIPPAWSLNPASPPPHVLSYRIPLTVLHLSCNSPPIPFLITYSVSSQPLSHLKVHPVLSHDTSVLIPSHPLSYILISCSIPHPISSNTQFHISSHPIFLSTSHIPYPTYTIPYAILNPNLYPIHFPSHPTPRLTSYPSPPWEESS